MMWSSGEEVDIPALRTPPPHIAQRFWHSGTNRRRSSAASSRRNSISSSQSHQSNRSFRTALHRNTIAQHLRRASILEDRKARLQDRAAHAEQVRQRAALAKASTRTSNSEEKAIAAKEAREKHLAKVAAACAEEVNRSKRIAEEHKERVAAEERRYRQELEDKHAEAERRRLDYLKNGRRPRTASATVQEDAKPRLVRKSAPNPNEACLTIQRTWRRSRRRRCAIDFQNLHLSIERIGQIDFEEATQLLTDNAVIERTGIMLRLLKLETGLDRTNTSTKTFLSAFMMLGHPNTVFSKNSEQEQDLISKAKDLLISFETVLSEFSSSHLAVASETHLQTLQQAYATYCATLTAWKEHDSSVLLETLINSFVALDAIWQSVKDDNVGGAASEYGLGIRETQVKLFSRIKRIAGPDRCNSMIKRAINQSRRSRSRRRPIGELRPRQLASSVADNNDTGSAADPISNSVITEPAPSDATPQEVGQDDFARLFSIMPANRVIVHELMIDPNYRVESYSQTRLRESLNYDLCESMRHGVANGSGMEWTVSMATNIQNRLLKLLRPENSLHQVLTQVLDLEHIRNQCQNGQFSYDKFFIFMADLLPRLCAPYRDDDVKAVASTLRSATDSTDIMIEKLFGLLNVIEMLNIDHINYLIGQRAPLLIREGIGYEQRTFQVALENSEISLHRTTRWWRNASLNVVTEGSVNDPRPVGQTLPFNMTYARGLTDLAIGSAPLRETDVPETLELDIARLKTIRADLLRFVVVGGVLSTAKNLLRRDIRTQWKPEAKRAFDALTGGFSDPEHDLAARISAIVESGHGMPKASKDHLANIVTRFLAEAEAGQLRDPVMKLLLQRLKGHIFNGLAAQSSLERVRIASTTSEGLANIGLGEFIPQIAACAAELGKIMQIDIQSHGVWLRRVAEEADSLGARDTPRVS